MKRTLHYIIICIKLKRLLWDSNIGTQFLIDTWIFGYQIDGKTHLGQEYFYAHDRLKCQLTSNNNSTNADIRS